MNAKEKLKSSQAQPELNLSLITLEKAEPISFWERLKKSFSPADLTVRDWERLESKPFRKTHEENQWRNF